MTRGPLYVDAQTPPDSRDRFVCQQDGRTFRYDLPHIKAAIARGEDVREWVR